MFPTALSYLIYFKRLLFEVMNCLAKQKLLKPTVDKFNNVT